MTRSRTPLRPISVVYPPDGSFFSRTASGYRPGPLGITWFRNWTVTDGLYSRGPSTSRRWWSAGWLCQGRWSSHTGAHLLQSIAAVTRPHHSMHPSLLLRLASQRTYMAGVGCQSIGFFLAFFARRDLAVVPRAGERRRRPGRDGHPRSRARSSGGFPAPNWSPRHLLGLASPAWWSRRSPAQRVRSISWASWSSPPCSA